MLKMFPVPLTSVALGACLLSNLGLSKLLISGWVALADEILYQQRDCLYFRL